jgi:hypothetical protein
MELKLNYNGSMYVLEKSGKKNKKGNWYCVKGKIPGYSGSALNIAVPTSLENELFREARKQSLLVSSDISIIKDTIKAKRSKSIKNNFINPFNKLKKDSPDDDDLDEDDIIKLNVDNFSSEYFENELDSEKEYPVDFEEIEPEIIG